MYSIGIDIGGTKIAAGIVCSDHSILKKASIPTLASRQSEAITADMAKLCFDLMEKAGIGEDEIESIGIACPGIANSETGEIVYSCNLPFRNFLIVKELGKYFKTDRIYVENDANAATLGEAVAGAAKGASNVVMITIGTGIGGGAIIDGKICSGFNFAAAELGHTVIVHKGRRCACGRRGCWEAYSAVPALVRMTRQKMKSKKESSMWKYCHGDIDKADARCAFDEMKKGDRAALSVVDEYIGYLACGITNMVNIFQPQILCIGGGLSGEGRYLVDPIKKIVEIEQYSRDLADKTEIKIAQLGNDAGIVGAAALGKNFCKYL